MKSRVAIVFGAFLAATGTAAAQGPQQSAVVAGVKGGLNVSKLSTEPEGGSSDWRPGIVAGGFVRMRLSDAFAIQPEVLYAMMGGKNTEVVLFEEDVQTLKLDYIQIPVLLHVSGGQRGIVRAFAVAGPTFGLRIKADQEAFETTFDRSNEFKKNDVGIALGAGVDIAGVGVELRYTLGVSDVLSDEGHDLTGLDNGKNRSFQLMGSFTFGR